MSFDFESYLKGLDPTSAYHVVPLVGGVVNLTVRASIKKEGAEPYSGLFSDHPSIIVKHATPYVAAVGPEAVISQTRQITEARALSLFDRHEPLHFVSHESGVEIPKVLYHDPSNHVLIMTDLGNLPNLSDVFSALGGYTPDRKPTGGIAKAYGMLSERSLSPSEEQYYEQIGTALGSFFGRLHSQKALQTIVDLSISEPQTFTNASLHQSVYEYAIKPLKSHLELFTDLIPPPYTARSLYTRIESDWLRPTTAEERSFILGDCWTGAVLVSAHSPPYPSTPVTNHHHHSSSNILQSPTIGVIDWEFASQTRGPHGDIPQFLAHLELFHHAARWHKSQHHIEALDTLISNLIAAYKSTSHEHGAPWSPSHNPPPHDKIPNDGSNSSDNDNPFKPPDPKSFRAKITRSALLGLASEMLNCIFWKIWPCHINRSGGDPCPASSSSSDSQVDKSTTTTTTVETTKKKSQPRRPSFQTSPPPKMTATTTTENEIHGIETVHLCPLIRDMARSAIWLILRAGEDEVEMCSDRNWAELRNGSGAFGWVGYDLDIDNDIDEESEEGPGGKSMKRRKWLLDLFV